MKKQEQQHKIYIGISKTENRLFDFVMQNKLAVFSAEDIMKMTGWDERKIYNLLYRLTKKGLLIRVKRNKYAVKEKIHETAFEIATASVLPSYISFWTALSYYGFTEQQVKPIQLATTKQAKNISIGNQAVELITLSPKRFYGYRREDGFAIAEKEKAMIDSLNMPKKCGGIEEIAKCLKYSWKEINRQKLIDYAVMYKSKSLVSRLG